MLFSSMQVQEVFWQSCGGCTTLCQQRLGAAFVAAGTLIKRPRGREVFVHQAPGAAEPPCELQAFPPVFLQKPYKNSGLIYQR